MKWKEVQNISRSVIEREVNLRFRIVWWTKAKGESVATIIVGKWALIAGGIVSSIACYGLVCVCLSVCVCLYGLTVGWRRQIGLPPSLLLQETRRKIEQDFLASMLAPLLLALSIIFRTNRHRSFEFFSSSQFLLIYLRLDSFNSSYSSFPANAEK